MGRSWVSRILMGGLAVIGLSVAAVLLVSASSDSPPVLACQQIKVESPSGQGSLAAATPEDAVLKTEWLSALGIPMESQRLVDASAGESPDSGIILKAPSADVPRVAPATATFQVFVKGEVQAEITITSAEDGTFYVGQVAHC